MSSVNNKASTSTGKNVGIGNDEVSKKNQDTGLKENHDTVCEENTTKNDNGKLPAPFKLASEHTGIQGGMRTGEKSPQTHVKDGMYDGGKPPSAFVTPGKGNGKDIEPDINEFYDSLVDFVDREGLEETDEERNGREEKEEEEKNKNKNKKLKTNEKENKNEEEKNEQNKETATATSNEVVDLTTKEMTYQEFKKWDLENNIPGLINQFWMSHPKVIWKGMCYWLHYNVDIAVPYKWNAVDFTCPYNKPPAKANKNENYKEMTMIQVIEKCEEFIRSPVPNSRNSSSFKEYLEKDPPKVVKLRKKVASLLKQIERMDTNISAGERHLKNLRTEGANDEEVRQVFSMLLKAKQEAATHKKQRKESEKAILCEFQSIQMSVDLAKEEQSKQSGAEKDAAKVKVMLARFATTTSIIDTTSLEDEEVIDRSVPPHSDIFIQLPNPGDKTNNDNTKNNNKNIENSNLIVDSTTRSQVSNLTSALSQDTNTIEIESAMEIEIENIPFSQCNLFKIKHEQQMKHLNLNNIIMKTDATVKMNPEVMSMLNPCTKEITKIVNNELQQTECHRWNSARKLEIFTSSGMFVNCLTNRPTIISIAALENNDKVEKLREQQDKLYNEFQLESQKLFNEYQKLELIHREQARHRCLEKSLKKIIRAHATGLIEKEEWSQFIKKVIKKNNTETTATSLDSVCGFTYLILLTGKACTSLVEWADLETSETMMKTLTSTLSIPKRLSETEANKQKTNDVLRIGNMVFLRPDMNVWKIANKAADDLQELVAEFSLGIKNKFYRKIIEQKANHAIKKQHYTASTVDMTAKVSKVLLNAKNLQDKLECSRFRKDIVKSTVDKLLSMNAAMKNSSAALKSKNKIKNNNGKETPNATTTQLRTIKESVTKNDTLNTKTQNKNKTNKQKTSSNVQNDAANNNTYKNTQQQQQQQQDDMSINIDSSHNVAATMRQQRREQEQQQQQQQQQYNQQYLPPQTYQNRPPQYQYNQNYNQQVHFSQQQEYNSQEYNSQEYDTQYDSQYHNNNFAYRQVQNMGRGGRGRNPGRGPGRGRMNGRGGRIHGRGRSNFQRQQPYAKRNLDGSIKDIQQKR
jgi:hypothetical protein